MMWSKPDNSTLFFFWSHFSLCGCLRQASSALFSERMDEDTCGWQWRMRGGMSKQPSRVREVSQREEKSTELEIKVGKNIYKASVEDFLKRRSSSQMSFFQARKKIEVSSSWWNSSDRFWKPPPDIIFTDVNIKMNSMYHVKKDTVLWLLSVYSFGITVTRTHTHTNTHSLECPVNLMCNLMFCTIGGNWRT